MGIGSLSLRLIINSTMTWIFYKEEEEGWREGQRTPESQNWNSVDCLKTLSFLFPQLQEIVILDNCQEIVLEMKKIDVELNILSKLLSFKAKGSPPDHDVNCTVRIAHTSHNCHNRRWCTFFLLPGVLFSMENTIFWPILTNFSYFVASHQKVRILDR